MSENQKFIRSCADMMATNKLRGLKALGKCQIIAILLNVSGLALLQYKFFISLEVFLAIGLGQLHSFVMMVSALTRVEWFWLLAEHL